MLFYLLVYYFHSAWSCLIMLIYISLCLLFKWSRYMNCLDFLGIDSSSCFAYSVGIENIAVWRQSITTCVDNFDWCYDCMLWRNQLCFDWFCISMLWNRIRSNQIGNGSKAIVIKKFKNGSSMFTILFCTGISTADL